MVDCIPLTDTNQRGTALNTNKWSLHDSTCQLQLITYCQCWLKLNNLVLQLIRHEALEEALPPHLSPSGCLSTVENVCWVHMQGKSPPWVCMQGGGQSPPWVLNDPSPSLNINPSPCSTFFIPSTWLNCVVMGEVGQPSGAIYNACINI